MTDDPLRESMDKMAKSILDDVLAKPKSGKKQATLKEKTAALKAAMDWEKLKVRGNPGEKKDGFRTYRDRINAASPRGEGDGTPPGSNGSGKSGAH